MEIVLIINWAITAIIAIFLFRDNAKTYEDLESTLQYTLELTKQNVELLKAQESVLEFLDNSSISQVTKDEIAIRLRGDINETSEID